MIRQPIFCAVQKNLQPLIYRHFGHIYLCLCPNRSNHSPIHMTHPLFINIIKSLCLLACILCFAGDADAARSSKGKKSNPKYASIVIEASTGKIIHQDNADAIRHPASLTKVMTLLILFDQMQAGKIKMTDRIRVSKRAASMSPTKLGVPAGGSISVRDAISAVVTESANDIATALAEHMAGSESAFANHMTRRAQQIGMSRTRFRNASGLPDPKQVTTARDMARMAKFILTYYPQYYSVFSQKSFTYKGVTHRNHNRLMEKYPGMDGIKTGFINASGFNLIASAKQNGIRLIGVVFGGQSSYSRNAHMEELLDAGFNEASRLYYAGQLTTKTASASADSQKPIIQTTKPSAPAQKPVRSTATVYAAEPHFDDVMGTYAGVPNEHTRIAQPDDTSKNVNVRAAAQVPPPYATTATNMSGGAGEWAIQIGAYQSRATTDQALYKAQQMLPSSLASKAQAIIVPMRAADATWVFRARLSGFTRDEALQACGYFKDCMTVAPAS